MLLSPSVVAQLFPVCLKQVQATVFLKSTLIKRRKRHWLTGFFSKTIHAQTHKVPKSLCVMPVQQIRSPEAPGPKTAQAPPTCQARETRHRVKLEKLVGPNSPPTHFAVECLQSSMLTSPAWWTTTESPRKPSYRNTDSAHFPITLLLLLPKTIDLISSFYRIGNNLNPNNLMSKIRIWTSIIFPHSSFWTISSLNIYKRGKNSTQKF